MRINFDPDEYKMVAIRQPCLTSFGDRMRCDGSCNGSFIMLQVRKSPAEIAAIKAERQRAHEDQVLAEADAIRRRRGGQAA